MSTHTITIDWHEGTGITAHPATITGPENTLAHLVWAAGTNVATIHHVTPLIDHATSAVLGSPQVHEGVFRLEDPLGAAPKTFNYTVTIFTNTNTTIISDPQIINNPET